LLTDIAVKAVGFPILSDGSDDGDEVLDAGPDPEEARVRFAHLAELHRTAQEACDRRDYEAYTWARAEAACYFMEFKLVPRVVDKLTSSLHNTIDQIRRHERQIMNLVVVQWHMPRQTYLDSFPKNVTNLNWIHEVQKGG
jgi:RNA polymerase primary sigma factor